MRDFATDLSELCLFRCRPTEFIFLFTNNLHDVSMSASLMAAFPWETAPRDLLRDRDRICDGELRRVPAPALARAHPARLGDR